MISTAVSSVRWSRGMQMEDSGFGRQIVVSPAWREQEMLQLVRNGSI